MDYLAADDDYTRDQTWTAYHEAGHAVVAWALGATIDQVSLWAASAYDDVDDGPRRFGDCRVRWPGGGQAFAGDPMLARELLVLVAGPVAEKLYRDDEIDIASVASWQADAAGATQKAELLLAGKKSGGQPRKLIAAAIDRVRGFLNRPDAWAAVAALADQIELGDPVEADAADELIGFWFGSAGR